MATFTVKLIHGVTGEVRRISLPVPPTLSKLREAVREHFKGTKRARLTFVDDEGDDVTIFDDASFAEVLELSKGKVARIKVIPGEGK